jgi:ABC-type uncharacterized transport system involved in gliding motility auxiliary subunit
VALMNPELRRFAPVGLYLALAAALAAGGFYFVQREWNLYVQVGVALVVFGLALFAFLDPDRVRRAFSGRQARYGSNALVMSIAFAGILVVLNYIVYDNPQRWDMTEDKQYTLAPETINALETIEQPIHAKAFYTSDLDTDTPAKLLDQFKFYSEGKFTYEFIDPQLDQVQAYEAGITRNGSIVLYQGTEKQIISSTSERELTSALVRLISPAERKVYFLTGHGELVPDAGDMRRIDFASRDLRAKNYTLETLNLIANNAIPTDAGVIVIVAPQQALLSAEVDLIAGFLEAGGGLVYLPEPVHLTQLGQANTELDAYLADAWGILLTADMIIDLTSNMSYEYAIGMDFGTHPITSRLTGTATILPTARSVNVVEAPSGISQVTLVRTSANSWSETDLEGLVTEGSEIQFDEGTADAVGPIGLAVASESFMSEGRVVVIGDSDFLVDEVYTAASNSSLFINSVDWAAGEEEIINIIPRQSTQRLLVAPQAWILNLITLGAVFILPGLMLLSGIVVWVQRRRRG